MRKCNGFYYRYNNGKSERVDFVNGKFHCYGVDWEEIGDGVINIKFTSPDGSGTCDCLTIETDDAEHFREQIRAYTAEGYKISSTGCIYGRWQAILTREV